MEGGSYWSPVRPCGDVVGEGLGSGQQMWGLPTYWVRGQGRALFGPLWGWALGFDADDWLVKARRGGRPGGTGKKISPGPVTAPHCRGQGPGLPNELPTTAPPARPSASLALSPRFVFLPFPFAWLMGGMAIVDFD